MSHVSRPCPLDVGPFRQIRDEKRIDCGHTHISICLNRMSLAIERTTRRTTKRLTRDVFVLTRKYLRVVERLCVATDDSRRAARILLTTAHREGKRLRRNNYACKILTREGLTNTISLRLLT